MENREPRHIFYHFGMFNDCPYTSRETNRIIHDYKQDINGPRFGKKRKKKRVKGVRKVSHYEN